MAARKLSLRRIDRRERGTIGGNKFEVAHWIDDPNLAPKRIIIARCAANGVRRLSDALIGMVEPTGKPPPDDITGVTILCLGPDEDFEIWEEEP